MIRQMFELHMFICIMSSVHSHLVGGIFWGSHPGALLEPSAERLIDADARIGRSPCSKYDMT